jgi:hypothetical protein
VSRETKGDEMPKLTAAELKILKYPPTIGTWVCRRKRKRDDGTVSECGMPNSSSRKSCWLCTTKKPAKPTLLWPVYVAVCKKAGVQPGQKVEAAA